MMRKTSRFAGFLATAAAFSMIATPAFAGGNWGWGGYRHRDRVDAGDVITGILIIGGIAAIASAANSNKKPRYDRRDDRRYDDARYEDDRNQRDDRPEWQEGTGVNAAIGRCLGEVGRGSSQNAEVDSVNREGDGWRVTGRAAGGQFSCSIDRDGRIRNVNVGGRAY